MNNTKQWNKLKPICERYLKYQNRMKVQEYTPTIEEWGSIEDLKNHKKINVLG